MTTKKRTGNRSSHTAVQKPSKSTPSAIPDPVAAAARMVELLNEMEAIIPDLTQPDITKIKRTSQGAKFGRALIPPMINAVNNYPPFQQRNMFDAAAGQDAIDYHGQMHPITQRMAAITMAIAARPIHAFIDVTSMSVSRRSGFRRRSRASVRKICFIRTTSDVDTSAPWCGILAAMPKGRQSRIFPSFAFWVFGHSCG